MMDFASLIIKAADNMQRGAENAATSSGKGNNGQDYQINTSSAGSGSAGGGYTPTEQDMSGVDTFKSKVSGISENVANAVQNNLAKDENQSSDERLKRIFGENDDAIQSFAKLNAIKFTYNDKAKEIHPDGENGVDGDPHYGIKAQELEQNPFTKSVVSEDSEGFKQIDTKELSAANTAVISEICRRLLLIEKVLGLEVK